ncbi:PREDICTED: uncharacterized protein LOC108556693 [Nicrophorus vespilloides]|uniref:Uncharacterized protein LOC108556693 n=1 Tax=Nicrophorus vespilloides TaxID=110193 RepID=A0ABM1M1D8_NICVS|nr:PREDICTED: uncharacterized protein LOC108556693 [Nicrophorus vespilloides]
MEYSKESLTSVLRKYEVDSTVDIKTVDVKRAVDIGNNFVSDVKKVTVTGSKTVQGVKKDFQKSIIVKELLKNKGISDSLNYDQCFVNEMIAYNKILPELKKYTVDGELPVPDCIYANESATALEDLCPEGYETVDRFIGFSVQQIEDILRVLAKLHSASLVMSEKDPKKLSELSKLIPELVFVMDPTGLAKSMKSFVRIAVRVFEELEPTERNREVLAMLNKYYESFQENNTKLFEVPRKYSVLNHGDAWGNNILLKERNVKFIDFQLMRFASVASDLTYFFCSTCKPSLKINLDHYLSVYLDSLHSHLMGFDINLKDILTMDWLRKEMYDFQPVGFVCSLWFLPLYFFKKEHLNTDMFTEKQLTDDELRWTKCTPEFKQRLIEMAYDFCTGFKI